MKKSYQYGIAALVVVAVIAIASVFVLKKSDTAAVAPASSSAHKAAESAVVDSGWSVRCPQGVTDTKKCEVFTRLEMKSSAMRVAEIAMSFPRDNSLPKGTARGVIILPLGVMLETGATMSVDAGKPFAFKSRFCTQGGCYSYVNLNKDILDTMKKGKQLNIFFKTADNNQAHLILGLDNFGNAINKIE